MLPCGRQPVRRRRVSCLFLTCGPLEELEEVETMPSSPDAQDPRAIDVSIANAEARHHWERLALYRARVHSGKPASLTRLHELERTAARAEARARHARGR
jgi:hypothetical protein